LGGGSASSSWGRSQVSRSGQRVRRADEALRIEAMNEAIVADRVEALGISSIRGWRKLLK
jgi:hypothetical protein